MTIHVLLADDHQVMRDGLRAIIEKDPYLTVCGEAGNGRDVLAQTGNHKPEIVIMDINMPALNGIEATRKVLAAHPQTAVIMLSMYSTKEHIYQAFKAGARGYLLKETSGKEVVEAIYAVHRGDRYISQAITETVLDAYIAQRGQGESSPLDRLSPREREVLKLVGEGYASAEIASQLNLTVGTVSTYRSRMMKKLEVKNLTELIKFAIAHHLIET